ncbi:MAG TPA: hypothetical protein PLP29_00465 [Candidatus Ozemobacteraceae bacterium]|nr:hypothetical protein [Candidatus Ozemobacteraceae bacterium]
MAGGTTATHGGMPRPETGALHCRCRRRAVTFIEIVIAMAVLTIALLPIFNMLHKGAEDTDLNASQAFAITKASDVLNAMLDNVPFETIRMGNPGYLSITDLPASEYSRYDANWLKGIAQMLFPGSELDGNRGYPCRGIITDPRGISYLVTLCVEDLAAPTAAADARPDRKKVGTAFPDAAPQDFDQRNELTFSFLQNPGKLSDPNWLQKYNPFSTAAQPPRWELELSPDKNGVAQPSENIYRDEGYGAGDDSPRFMDPTAARYTQRMSSEKVNYTKDDTFAFCTMKRLIVEIQWNMDKKFYKNPDSDGSDIQRIHLITMKGDINR